jgi:hypothetical protein
MRPLAAALAAAGLAAAPAPAEEGGAALDLWPLVVRDARPVAGLEATRIAGPFFERWHTPDEEGFTLRPLLAGVREEEASRLEFLYPLGELVRREGSTRLRLTPFLDRTLRAEPVGEAAPAAERRGWTFGPAFGGRTEAGEPYFGIFPLFGVARERFGLERLEFWLFPLFARSRDASGYARTHVLWPFFSFGSGGGRRSLRVWPLFGTDVREGDFERRFALWPLLHWRRERIGDPALERRVRLFLPFYGETQRAHARSRFVLGPLYLHAENDLTGARRTDWLWPFLGVASRPPRDEDGGASELRVEPFFRRERAPGFRRTGSLFGAVRSTTLRSPELELDASHVLFVSRFERSLDRLGGRERVRRELWPFFRAAAARDADGSSASRSQAPWLLPLGGEGWLRHGLGLLTLFERRSVEDESRTDWLWGLVRSRSAPGYSLEAVSWLYRRETTPAGSRLRILGIPFDSGSADGDADPLFQARAAD